MGQRPRDADRIAGRVVGTEVIRPDPAVAGQRGAAGAEDVPAGQARRLRQEEGGGRSWGEPPVGPGMTGGWMVAQVFTAPSSSSDQVRG